MTNTPHSLLSSALPLTLAVSLAAALGLAAVGPVPTRWLSGPAALPAMWAAIAVALAGSWAGSIAPLVCLRRAPTQFVAGYFLGLGVRFAVTLLLTLTVYWLVPGLVWNVLLVWVGVAQAVLLAGDTALLLRLCAARGGATQ